MSKLSETFSFLTKHPQFTLAIIAFVFQSLFFVYIVMSNTIEVPHSDMIPVLTELTKSHSPAELFLYQYATHFQGIGYIITYITLQVFSWKITSLSGLSASIQITTGLLALLLVYRIFKRIKFTDILIPIVILSTKAHELHIVIPNISSAVLPIHMIFLTSVILTVHTKWKFVALTLLGVLTIYTGYGIITLPLFYTIFAILLIKNSNKEFHLYNFIAFSIAATYLIYSYNPTFDASCLHSMKETGDYLVFINQMFLNYFHLHRFITPVSPLILLMASMTIYHVIKAVHSKNPYVDTHLVLFLFYGFSTLAAISTSIGRICFGGDAGNAPRYTIFFVTAIIATYIDLQRALVNHKSRVFIWIFMAIVILTELFATLSIITVMKNVSNSAKRWVLCYQKTKSIHDCSYSTGFYPAGTDPQEYVGLYDLLLYSEQNHVLFFTNNNQ